MKPVTRWATALALGAGLLLAGGAAAGGRSFTDIVGDAGAPDITRVTIAGDPASGSLSISVTAGGMFAIDRGWEPDVSVWLDTDRNDSTGSASGCEYGLKFWRSPTGPTWHILRWNATNAQWEISPPAPTATFSRAGDVLTWRLATADLAGASGFDLWIASAVYEDRRISAQDVAPATGRWHYDLSATPVTFSDAVHDAAAPDISTVSVGTDRRSVTTVAITARGLSAISRTLKPEVGAYLNTDGNLSTGWVGFDYRLYYRLIAGDTVWRIDRWGRRANAWRRVTRSPAQSFGRRGDVVSWRFTRADIGNPTRFGFIVLSQISVPGAFIDDSAPGFGSWAYAFPLTK